MNALEKVKFWSSRSSFSDGESIKTSDDSHSDLIQLRSSPHNTHAPSSETKANSTPPLDIKARNSLRKKSFENSIELDDSRNVHSEEERFSQLVTPTATCFSTDDLDDIFKIGRKSETSMLESSPQPINMTSLNDSSKDSENILSDFTNPLARNFSKKKLNSSSSGSIKESPGKSMKLDLSVDHSIENGEILNPRTPFTPLTPDGRLISPIQMVCREIFVTEKTYVKDLQEVIEGYIYHLKQQTDLDVESIFGNLEGIYEFNKEVLYQLEQCQLDDNELDPVQMATVFIGKSRGFNHHYTQYCTNYPEASSFFSIIMLDEGISKFFMERQRVIGHALSLESYLLKPIQRIMKYHLLFRDILKRYEGEPDGYDVINAAVSAMTDVAEYINEMKRLHENAMKVQEILSCIIDLDFPIDIYVTGRLVMENSFKIHGSRGDRFLYLFEKLLLICKRTEDKYMQLKEKIECSNMMLVESLSKDPLAFQIMRFDNQKVNYTIIAKSQEIKRAWVQHLKRLILENHAALIPQTARQAILGIEEKAKSKYTCLPMNALDDQVMGTLRNIKSKTLPRSPHGKENMIQMQPGVKRESNEKDLANLPKRSLNTKAKEYLMDKKNRTTVSASNLLHSSSSPGEKEKKEKLRWIRRHKHKPSLDGALLLEENEQLMLKAADGLSKSRSLESLKDSRKLRPESIVSESQILKDIINAKFENIDNEESKGLASKRTRPLSSNEPANSTLSSTEIARKVLKENDDKSSITPATKLNKSASMNLPNPRKYSDDNNNEIEESTDRWSVLSQEAEAMKRLEKRLSLLADDDTSATSIKNMVRKVSNAFNSSFHDAYDDSPHSIIKNNDINILSDIDVSRDLDTIFGTSPPTNTVSRNKSRYRRSTGGLTNASIFIPSLGRSRSELSVFSERQNTDPCAKLELTSILNTSAHAPLMKDDEKKEWNQSVDQVFDEVNAELDSLADSITSDTVKSQESEVESAQEVNDQRPVGMDINERAAFVDSRLREANDKIASPHSVRKINVEVKRVADRIKEYKKIIDAEKRITSWRHREPKTMNEMMESLDSISSGGGALSPVYSSYRRRFRISKDLDNNMQEGHQAVVRSFSESFNPERSTSVQSAHDRSAHDRTRSLTTNLVTDDSLSGSSSSLSSGDLRRKTTSNENINKRTEKYHQALKKGSTKKKNGSSMDPYLKGRTKSYSEGKENRHSGSELFFLPSHDLMSRCDSHEWLNKAKTLPEPKRTNAIKRAIKQHSEGECDNDDESSAEDHTINVGDKTKSLPTQVTLILRVDKSDDSSSSNNNNNNKTAPPVKAKPARHNNRSTSVPASRRALNDKGSKKYSSQRDHPPRRLNRNRPESLCENETSPRGRSTVMKHNINSGKYLTMPKQKKHKLITHDNQAPSRTTIRSASLPRRSKKNLEVPPLTNQGLGVDELPSSAGSSSILRSPSIRCIQQNHVNIRIKEYFTNLERSSSISQSKPNLVLVGTYNSSSEDTDTDTSSAEVSVAPSSVESNNTDHILRGTVRSMIKRYVNANYVFDT